MRTSTLPWILLVTAACGSVEPTGVPDAGTGNADAGVGEDAIDDRDAADLADAAEPTPADCAGWQDRAATTDGPQSIDPDGAGGNPAFTVWCADMATAEPREYLELVNASTPAAVAAALATDLSSVSNYVVVPGGGSSPGCTCAGTAITTFSRVRIDPATLVVQGGDYRFAETLVTGGDPACWTSNDSCNEGPHPLGSPLDCRWMGSSGGRAQVDLRGTPLFLAHHLQWDHWDAGGLGWGTAGVGRIASDRKTAVATGGGFCGGLYPAGPGHFQVPLAFTDQAPAFTPALSNGAFATGTLAGWAKTGGGASFVVAGEPAYDNRMVVRTGDALTGSIHQSFVVPADATLLIFALGGSKGQVVVRDVDAAADLAAWPAPNVGGGMLLQQRFVLLGHAGKHLRITVDDPYSDGGLVVGGFEVVRGGGRGNPVRNPNWLDEGGKVHWSVTGDMASMDHTYWTPHAQYRHWGVHSYMWSGANLHEAGTGAIYQTFQVPTDAVGLRFAMSGGNQSARLYGGAVTSFPAGGAVATAQGPSNNDLFKAVSWNLLPYRGQTMTIALEDFSTGGWGWVNASEIYYVSETSGP